MTLDQHLDALRGALPACRAAAYIDLQAELVLTASTVPGLRREMLDALAEAARRLFAAEALSGDMAADLAVVLTVEDAHVFVRDGDEPGEALCCLCSLGTDVELIASEARGALTRILAAE